MTNCRTGKADEALSFWFLMQWLLGDVTNLIGAVLTRQLATQVRGEGGKERESEGVLEACLYYKRKLRNYVLLKAIVCLVCRATRRKSLNAL